MTDDRMRIFGIPRPRRTLDWLEWTLRACMFTMIIAFAGLLFTAASAAEHAITPNASDVPLRLTDIAIFLALGGQTAAIAFFAGGLAARVSAIEAWRREHLEWADRQVERLERADETLRTHPHQPPHA